MPCQQPSSRPYIRRFAIIAACLSEIFASASASPGGSDEGFAKLVSWMKLHGGRVDSRIDVSTNDDGVRGAFALSAIEEGTELLFCPWELVIGSAGMQDQMQKGDGMCGVVERMADEMRLESRSMWHPYLDHIELPRLAANWGASALAELQGLLPIHEATRHMRWFQHSCGGDLGDAAAVRSLVAFTSRASDVGMVPIYDLLNHHNGKRNAKLSLAEDGVRLVAVGKQRDGGDRVVIERGQEIYLSYGLKTASSMYRDYGFVEEWPTCWNFEDPASGDNFAFVLYPSGNAAINPSAEFLRRMFQSDESLAECEEGAARHTGSLSAIDLERFARAAHARLREFPSTLGEDRRLLFAEKQALLVASSGGSSGDIEDVIDAMNYRIAFKSALTSSYIYAESMAAGRANHDAGNLEL